MITLWFAVWRRHSTIQQQTSIANRQTTIFSTRLRLRSDLLREYITTPLYRFFYSADMDAVSINQQKTSVGNRVALIQEETAAATWRHVPSQSNPADLISRGIQLTTQSTSTLWWKGPQWLTQQPSSWPKQRLTHLQTTWKLEKCILHVYKFQMTSHQDSPSWTDSSESLHTAEDHK